ncbi:MAG: hypothetical protein VKJ06_00205 [Vampirovibrionales bacterium]|nr:hypothetical protein [Vampirovibrionales bacterium]
MAAQHPQQLANPLPGKAKAPKHLASMTLPMLPAARIKPLHPEHSHPEQRNRTSAESVLNNPIRLRQQQSKQGRGFRQKLSQLTTTVLLIAVFTYGCIASGGNAASLMRLLKKVPQVQAIHHQTHEEAELLSRKLRQYSQSQGREALLRNALDYTRPNEVLVRFRVG